MGLTRKLLSALRGDGKGFAMIDVLKKAKARGVTRKQAEEAVVKLLDQLPDEPSANGVTSEADLTTEILMLTQNYCRPEYRIWPNDVE